MTKRHNEQGFTLIELLISLTLLGLLLMLLYGGLHFGVRAWERTTTQDEASQTQDIAQSLLRRELERICVHLAPTPADAPNAAPRIHFDGTQEHMRILAPMPDASGAQRCAPLALIVVPVGGLKTLMFSLRDGSRQTALLRKAQDIQFSYQQEGGIWRSDWRGQPRLPVLIRVRVTFPPGDRRFWPELFIAPRLSASPDCNYDAALGACRGS
jgi:general secretion pathway protein J